MPPSPCRVGRCLCPLPHEGKARPFSTLDQWGLHPSAARGCASLPARHESQVAASAVESDPGVGPPGRTDAWIAHQLEVTVQQIQSFKRENELEADGESAGAP